MASQERITNISQETDPFIQASKRTPVDLAAWATSMMEKQNRRSHLISQPQEVTTDLLNGTLTSPTAFNAAHAAAAAAAQTPTQDISHHMQHMSIDPNAPRPFPARTSSQPTVGMNGMDIGSGMGISVAGTRPPPSGPLPQIPQNGPPF
jgi:mitogen-activated protein kinase kinase